MEAEIPGVQGVVEDLLMGLWTGGLADVVELAVVAVKHDGHLLSLRSRHLEVATEIEPRVLAHPRGRARPLDQAVGVIGLAHLLALGRGAADEHARTLAARLGLINRATVYYGTTRSREPLSD